eukprot:654827-Pelagomonas_calceolata.AAC.3
MAEITRRTAEAWDRGATEVRACVYVTFCVRMLACSFLSAEAWDRGATELRHGIEERQRCVRVCVFAFYVCILAFSFFRLRHGIEERQRCVRAWVCVYKCVLACLFLSAEAWDRGATEAWGKGATKVSSGPEFFLRPDTTQYLKSPATVVLDMKDMQAS